MIEAPCSVASTASSQIWSRRRFIPSWPLETGHTQGIQWEKKRGSPDLTTVSNSARESTGDSNSILAKGR